MSTPRSLDKRRQFVALLRKNFILQTRGRRSFLGIGGLAGLILQLLLPVSFFLVMYLPKHYIMPIRHGETMGEPPIRLESRSWAEPYDGPATFHSHGGRAALLLSPDTVDVRGLALVLAKTLACPRDPRLRICPSAAMPASFHCMFIAPNGSYSMNGSVYGSAAADILWKPEEEEEVEEEEEEERGSGLWAGDGRNVGGKGTVTAAGWPYWTSNEDGGNGVGVGLLRPRWSRSRRRRQMLTGPPRAAAGAPEAVVSEAAAGAAGPSLAADPCADFTACVSTPACYEHVLQSQISFVASEEAARHATVTADQKWDAVVHFPLVAVGPAAAAPAAVAAGSGGGEEGLNQLPLRLRSDLRRHGSAASAIASASGGVTAAGSGGGAAPQSLSQLLSSLTVGMNHTDVPPTRFLLDLFDVVPTRGNGLALYRRYWFFTNLQLAISRAVIGIHVAANSPSPPPPSPPPSPPPPPSPAPPPPPPESVLESGNITRQQETPADQKHSRDPQFHSRGLYGISITQLDAQIDRGEGHGGGGADAGAAAVGANPYDAALPANVEVSYKAFPWPAVTEDLGAAGAAVFFQLLLVYAFLPPTRAVVGDIVREKELRLREGMRVLGLSEPSYWLSWGLTHWLLLAISGALCTAAGTYPFANSSAAIMLTFFWLYGAALVSYSYCMSTLFSSSRVAGTVVQLLYALSMLPGFVLPSVYPYGSWTWYGACLAPPSAATLFAAVLVNWEKVAEGINPATLWTPITQANGFCASTVLWMLALDVVLYGGLTWYLDKVLPKSYGQRLPWWFMFDRRYWASAGSGGTRHRRRHSSSSGGGVWRRLLGLKEKLWGRGGGSSVTRSLLTAGGGDDGGEGAVLPATSEAAVEVRGLVKVFRALTGEDKVAVDHLDLKMESGRITALLGHNGAGKTTTIHILTGMLQPTAGSATVNGFDVATQMEQVRASLGICPQFDILWPELTVSEHLELYGAIKGCRRDELPRAAASAAASVGLTPKLHCPAGELSGGQRRKLSVAIAFLGNPAVVFLDEPTSGMDPYSRRFTWEVIRQHRSEAAIVLTTHSMEEADLLGDRVVILARGRVAAEGTGMELKANYGVGYNLTLVLDPRQQQQQSVLQPGTVQERSAADLQQLQPSMIAGADLSPEVAVMDLVRRHVPAAALISAAGAEVVVRLPREAAGAFPALLRDLDGPVGRQQLGVASYGVSLTTLEEVFLSINAAAERPADGEAAGPATAAAAPAAPAPPTHLPPLHGWRLYGQQLRALFAKRALCARRERLAVMTQLVVPLALVYLALWISSLQVREPSEPPLDLSRLTALFGRSLVWSAAPAVRNASVGCSSGPGGGGDGGSSCLAALLGGHPAGGRSIDSGATALYGGDPRTRSTTLEDYLLRLWYRGEAAPVYDALHFTGLPSPAAIATTDAAAPPLSFVLLTNQSAVSALPAALAGAMTAVSSYIDGGLRKAATGGAGGDRGGGSSVVPPSFSAVSWPLPTLGVEPVARVQRDAASLMLVLCLVLASSVLSASFVVFIVREQDNNSKHLQLVSGAPATAYWAANYGWDLISYSLSAGGLLALIVWYRLPQYGGPRLPAVAGLLWGFGPAGISLTYLLHFLFRDEMRALQRLNTAYFLTGYLGFIATWICDLILMLVRQPGSLSTWNAIAKAALRTASPHYCFARGMYDVQATYDSGGLPFGKRGKPFDWDVFGSPMAHMAAQTLVYGTLAVLYDAGVLTAVRAYCQDAVRGGGLRWRLRQQRVRHADGGGDGRGDGRGEEAHLLALEGGVPLTSAAPGATAGAASPGSHTGWDGQLYGVQSRTAALGGRSSGPEARLSAGVSVDGDVCEAAGDDDDDDVAAEKAAVMDGRRDRCQVLLDGVRKSYSQGFFRPAVAAVRGLWVGVPAGECFGLLGVNGAGKTTTFRMLTGEVMPDSGDALVGAFSVRTQLSAARRQLGYCPQFEALPGAMTGREVAAMYARLRGVPEPAVAGLVAQLLRRLGLEGAADAPCGGYSGGMKRKLGVAVALVGDPRVCALDEPSTGMDPGARRGLWTCLQNEVIRAGRTVVLTSHSMEECEALCTRLTILVAGRLRCLGTVQHLKSRFGRGYVLEIKTQPRSISAVSLEAAAASAAAVAAVQPPLELSTAVAAASAINVEPMAAARAGGAGTDAAALAAWVASVCPGAVLSRVDQNRFTFTIPRAIAADAAASSRGADGSMDVAGGGAVIDESNEEPISSGRGAVDLAALFQAMESRRAALGVVDYTLTQTTLEQLFVSLAGAAAASDSAGL